MTSLQPKSRPILELAAPGLLMLSLVVIHFSPAVSSICLALSITLALLTLKGTSMKLADLPIWVWGFPLLFVLQPLWAILLGQNLEGIWSKLLLKLPLLFVPLFFSLGLRTPKGIYWLIAYTLPLSWLSLAGIINYFNHMQFYNQMVLESKPIPVYSQVYHIEYSLLLSLACLLLFSTLVHIKTISVGFKYLLIAILGINFIGLHVLSARTGLLAFWVGMALWFVANRKQFLKTKTLIWVGLTAALFIVLIPSVRNRLLNTFEDITAVAKQKDLNNKSFGQRWVAWDMSLKAIQKQPLSGYGFNGAGEAMKQEYAVHGNAMEEKNRIGTHNQYLQTALESGWLLALGLLLFLGIAVFWGLKNTAYYGYMLGIAIVVAMVFESILERQSGILAVAVLWPFFSGMHHFQKD